MNLTSKKWLDAWHVNPSANKDYDLIDGLRGIAILMVLMGHLIYVNPHSGPLAQFIIGVCNAGGYGVMVFFTLSGFLIAWPFWKRKVKGAAEVLPPGYGWRRFWKIYPPLALSVVVLAPVYILFSHDRSYLPLALNWLSGLPFLMPVSDKFNPVMWSLVVEVHFYIFLPLFFLGLKRLSAKACFWMTMPVFLIVPAVCRWMIFNGLGYEIFPQIVDHFPSVLDCFFLGVLLAGAESIWGIPKPWARLGDAGLALLPATLFAKSWLDLYPAINRGVQIELVDWMVRIASALLLCYIADPQHPRARLLCQPWLRWCGIISYEWYLFHQPIAIWFRSSFGPANGNRIVYVLIVVGAFAVSLLVAALVYKYFSLPILKRGRAKHTH